jgi:hypothetical protein
MPDEPTPQKVTPTVNWASLSQTILLGVITGLQGVQLSLPRPAGDPNIPPAPPAPAITAATLHDDNVELKKLLGELGDKLDALKPKK